MQTTPILFLIFNRPEKTKKVLEVLQILKPAKLYIVADGPREGNLTDISLCNDTRDLALKMIDWPCELITQFRNENVGCGKGVSDAITWFFNQVEEGIILEDDCLPDLSFFEFCSVLLNRYRDNHRIMHIGGNNFQFGQIRGDGDYYYSFFSHNWGWATWRRAWSCFQYDLDCQKLEILNICKETHKKNKPLSWFLDNRFEEIKMPQNHIWDIQWHFAIIKNKGLSITPNKNLVKNIGFGSDATHTLNVEDWLDKHINGKLDTFIPPSRIELNHEGDQYTMDNHFKINIFCQEKMLDKQIKNQKKKRKIKTLIKLFLPLIILKVFNKIKGRIFSENKLIKTDVPEKDDINQLPRYTAFETNFLGNSIKVLDNASFKFMRDEIFESEIYKFDSDNSSPYIVDCGANIGLSIIYFKTLFPSSEIMAFEPDPKVFEILNSNIISCKYDNVTIVNKAIWHNDTTLKFYSEGADGGRTAIESDFNNIIEVKAISLREYLNKKVDFLKIDIEGAEYLVLSNISDLLLNVDRLFVEYHSFIGQEQFLPELIKILKDAGFRIHISAPGLTSSSPFMQLKEYANMDNQLNIFGFR